MNYYSYVHPGSEEVIVSPTNKSWHAQTNQPTNSFTKRYVGKYEWQIPSSSSSSSSHTASKDFPDSVSIYIRLYDPSLPIGVPNSTLCLQRADVNKLFLVAQYSYSSR